MASSPPARSPVPSRDSGFLAPPATALSDAQNWEPHSRLGRLLMIPVGLIPGPRLLRAHQVSAGVALFFANVIGVAIVIALNLWVIPGTREYGGSLWGLIVVLTTLYIVVAFPLGGYLIYRQSNLAWAWLRQGREPTETEELDVLQAPIRVLRVLVTLWLLATLMASTIGLIDSWRLGLRIAITTALGGLSVSTFGYLLTERVMRPAGRVVLSHRGSAAPPALPGAATRQLVTWALGTGAALLGVWIVGLSTLTNVIEDPSAHSLAVSMFVLGSIALGFGFAAEYVSAHAVSDPIHGLRSAIAKLTEGDLTARVRIDDATEIGLLQAGFNRMAAGIEEREQLRDLFGKHVGDEVANSAIARGSVLGGETLHVAAMFVDVVGSTTLAMQRPATEVVELINRFFEVVVSSTAKHGGLVNKFAGDGALIVFGAPVPQADCATRALRAARELAIALEELAPETPATIGVSGGDVIAGNMGTTQRFEYTVMGDPVNEAARLNGQSKQLPSRVAASGRLVEEADEEERRHWELSYSVVLRGRTERTDVYAIRTNRTEPGVSSS